LATDQPAAVALADISDALNRPAASSASSYRGACQPFRGVSDLIDPEWLNAADSG
jgi:hypothetical protein